MSFYRTLVAAVAAMGLASVAFAADEVTPAADQSANSAMELSANTTQTTTDTTTQTTTTEQTKVNINKASVKDLAKVKGLNSTKAKAIVAYRKKHGDFKSIDDLKNVHGMKKMNEKTMQELENQLTTG